MNFAYSNVTLSALRARQCDGHTTRNSFNVELNFCLVGICMELSVVSSFQSRKEFVTPRLAKKASVLAQNLSISRGGGVAYIYIYVYILVDSIYSKPCKESTDFTTLLKPYHFGLARPGGIGALSRGGSLARACNFGGGQCGGQVHCRSAR